MIHGPYNVKLMTDMHCCYLEVLIEFILYIP